MTCHIGRTGEAPAKLSHERTGTEYVHHYVLQSLTSNSKECDSEFVLNIVTENAERVYMSQKVVETEINDPPSFPEDASVHNDENKCVMSHRKAKTAESDSISPCTMMAGNDIKGCFLTQKMPRSKSESPACRKEDIGRKCSYAEPHLDAIINDSDANPPSSSEDKNAQLGDASVEANERSNLVGQHLNRKNSKTKIATDEVDQNFQVDDLTVFQEKQGKYFYYDSPLYEETGIWIPVSIPPMSESEHQEWTSGFCSTGGYHPEAETGWGQCLGEEKELTMWDVVVEMLLAARGKVNSLASGDITQLSWIPSHLVEQAWKEMAQTLSESSLSTLQEILESDPPKWLPDSSAPACMLCNVRFHPIMCSRHHCRFCGGIFCSDCSRGRSLLPEKFRSADPQRVCDVCCVRLESVQPYLMDQVSRAAQMPTHDITDLSTLRSWINFPWGQSMEYEIYKATNAIQGYRKVGMMRPERRIPEAILRHAKGLAIISLVKVGVMVTYNIGTGLVIARRKDGSWSPPSAISSFGMGWGAQAGGELTDLIIVLSTDEAVHTFSGDAHLSVGAGVSAAVGIIGRTAEADLRAGTTGYAACYTYSCSKGAFIGCALEGSIVTTRARENSRFYGCQSVTASDILIGSLPRPPAASILYRALGDLYKKL